MSSELTPFLSGLEEANKRVVNSELAEELIRLLSKEGYCSSHQAESWRVVNRPRCPIKVQLEIGNEASAEIDIVPLSAYTDTLDERFPLSGLSLPHAVRLPFKNKEDVEAVVARIDECFPKR